MIHSLRAFSICSCWPALIFFDFFNAPGLKSTVFIHSLYFSKIIEMAEQLIPYLSMVVFLQKPGLFESSMILNFCSDVCFEVLEEPSLINIFSQKLQKNMVISWRLLSNSDLLNKSYNPFPNLTRKLLFKWKTLRFLSTISNFSVLQKIHYFKRIY